MSQTRRRCGVHPSCPDPAVGSVTSPSGNVVRHACERALDEARPDQRPCRWPAVTVERDSHGREIRAGEFRPPVAS